MEHDNSRNEPGPGELGAANRSLADALRVSFRLLSVIMVLTVLAWLVLTGTSCIGPTERAVKLVFGRIQGKADGRVLAEGLAWSWPEPIGRIQRVPVKEQSLQINDFWLFEKPGDVDIPLGKRRPVAEGLRPGWDGTLMTGDRGLVHMKIVCRFKTGAKEGAPEPDSVIRYLLNVHETGEAVRSAVCTAAIHAAAKRTLDAILVTAQSEFAKEVKKLAQQRLDGLGSGIHIQSIKVPNSTVPLAAIGAFDAVTNARQEWESQTNQAKGAAIGKLTGAAGVSWQILIGDAERSNRPEAGASAPAGGKGAAPADVKRDTLFQDYARARREKDLETETKLLAEITRAGLLNLYAEARERGDEKLAEEILEEVNRVLLSNRTGGRAARVINAAKGYSAGIRQRVKARAARFNQLVGKFEATPEVLIQRLWANVKTEILTDPRIEKFYVPPGQKMILRVSGDPRIKRQILRKLLQAKSGPPQEPEVRRPPLRRPRPGQTDH